MSDKSIVYGVFLAFFSSEGPTSWLKRVRYPLQPEIKCSSVKTWPKAHCLAFRTWHCNNLRMLWEMFVPLEISFSAPKWFSITHFLNRGKILFVELAVSETSQWPYVSQLETIRFLGLKHAKKHCSRLTANHSRINLVNIIAKTVW